jgi:predicted small integral membrane protein
VRFLNFVGAISFFQIVGFVLAIPIIYAVSLVAELLQLEYTFTMVSISILVVAIASVVFARKFYLWISKQAKGKQLALSIPLVVILAIVVVAESVYDEDTSTMTRIGNSLHRFGF